MAAGRGGKAGAAVNPHRKANDDKPEQGGERVAGSGLLQQHPHQPGNRAVERKCQKLLAPQHPDARARVANAPANPASCVKRPPKSASPIPKSATPERLSPIANRRYARSPTTT